MRRYKVDANENSIVQALRKTGASVLRLAAVGNGCPDLLVNRAGELFMLEIKRDDVAPSQSRKRLSVHQRQFHRDWPVTIVCTVDEALKAIGVLK